MYALSVYLENIEFVCTVPLYLMSHFSLTDPTCCLWYIKRLYSYTAY